MILSDKNGGRRILPNLKLFASVFPADSIPTVEELEERVKAKAREISGGDRSNDQRQLDLFGDEFTNWDHVPIASLEDRELPPPSELLPQSHKATLRFCRQLIDRGENDELIVT